MQTLLKTTGPAELANLGERVPEEHKEEATAALAAEMVCRGTWGPRAQDAHTGPHATLPSAGGRRYRLRRQGMRAAKLDALVRYFKAALEYVAEVHLLVEQAMELLTSRVKSDVVEAVVLLTVASECGVEAAEPGVRQMVHLIWSKDESSSSSSSSSTAAAAPGPADEPASQEPARSLREHLMQAYKTLFLTADPSVPPKEQAQQVSRNLFGYGPGLACACNALCGSDGGANGYGRTGDRQQADRAHVAGRVDLAGRAALPDDAAGLLYHRARRGALGVLWYCAARRGRAASARSVSPTPARPCRRMCPVISQAPRPRPRCRQSTDEAPSKCSA